MSQSGSQFLRSLSNSYRRTSVLLLVGLFCWLIVGLLSAVGGCQHAVQSKRRPVAKTTSRKIHITDQTTLIVHAPLDRYIPPELTDSPMPAGLQRCPDVPRKVAEAFAAKAAKRTASNQGRPCPEKTSLWNMSGVRQLATQLAMVLRETLTEPAAGNPQPAASLPIRKAGPGERLTMTDQWGGSSHRNNVVPDGHLPLSWAVGEFDLKTGRWLNKDAKLVRWAAPLGSQTYGTPIVAGGKVFVATNNGAGYLPRYPKTVDLGCLLCFRESDGKFLWQYSAKKLASGAKNDWPEQGICCAPLVENDRLWCVTNRGEVVCLDTEGFLDGENDGPFRDEGVASSSVHEADTVWRLDMMKQLHIFQHNMCSCSVTARGNILFVDTSNGVDESHDHIPAPDAPSFIAVDKRTGKVLWTDRSPGRNILHGQWSSPAVGVLGGVPQVIFAGGDGWVYSFRADGGKDGKPELLWKFDVNPKTWKWVVGGAGKRNNIIATPVIYKERVYIASGQDPECGEGPGYLWCIDPTRRGDVSPWLAVEAKDHSKILPVRRIQAVIPEQGEEAIKNPNSAAVWGYRQNDANGDGEIDFEEEMHRAIGMVAIKNDLLFIGDFAGLFHCLDAKTGKVHWTYDLMAPVWGTPLIVGDYVAIADEEGDVRLFKLTPKPHEPIAEINMNDSIYTTPTFRDDTLFISTRSYLFAIGPPRK